MRRAGISGRVSQAYREVQRLRAAERLRQRGGRWRRAAYRWAFLVYRVGRRDAGQCTVPRGFISAMSEQFEPKTTSQRETRDLKRLSYLA